MAEEFHYLTKTAIELHNDKKFISKRIREQADYMKDLHVKHILHQITTDRYCSLYNAALDIAIELRDRLQIINHDGPVKFCLYLTPSQAEAMKDFDFGPRVEKKINIAY